MKILLFILVILLFERFVSGKDYRFSKVLCCFRRDYYVVKYRKKLASEVHLERRA
jgi:hypothetical protein